MGYQVSHGVWRSALISVVISSIAVSLAHRQDQHQHLLISHLINQAESGGTELDLVAVSGSAQFAQQCLRVKGRSKGIEADLQRLLPIRQPGIGDAA
jgi:hypothetical protein